MAYWACTSFSKVTLLSLYQNCSVDFKYVKNALTAAAFALDPDGGARDASPHPLVAWEWDGYPLDSHSPPTRRLRRLDLCPLHCEILATRLWWHQVDTLRTLSFEGVHSTAGSDIG